MNMYILLSLYDFLHSVLMFICDLLFDLLIFFLDTLYVVLIFILDITVFKPDEWGKSENFFIFIWLSAWLYDNATIMFYMLPTVQEINGYLIVFIWLRIAAYSEVIFILMFTWDLLFSLLILNTVTNLYII